MRCATGIGDEPACGPWTREREDAMGRAGGSRGPGLGKLVLWIGLLLMTVVVGCGSEEERAPAAAVDATGSGDQIDLPDSAEAQKAECEAQKAECEAKNGDRVKAYWGNSGTCVLEVNLGAACGSGPAECRGSCVGEGQCSGPGSQTSCGKGAGECSRCDGKGIRPPGSSAVTPSPAPADPPHRGSPGHGSPAPGTGGGWPQPAAAHRAA